MTELIPGQRVRYQAPKGREEDRTRCEGEEGIFIRAVDDSLYEVRWITGTVQQHVPDFLVPIPPKIEAGKFYRMRNGLKAEITCGNPVKIYPWIGTAGVNISTPKTVSWMVHGSHDRPDREDPYDIVAEWVDPPAGEAAPAVPEPAPAFKLGDRVRYTGANRIDFMGKQGEVTSAPFRVGDKDLVSVSFEDGTRCTGIFVGNLELIPAGPNFDTLHCDANGAPVALTVREGGKASRYRLTPEDADVPTPTAERYWMVHGDGPSRHQHSSREDAEREARRLARASPGTTFAVLEVVAAFLVEKPEPPPVLALNVIDPVTPF